MATEKKIAQGSFYPFEIHFKRQDLFEEEDDETCSDFKYALVMSTNETTCAHSWKAMGKISGIVSIPVCVDAFSSSFFPSSLTSCLIFILLEPWSSHIEN